MAYFDIDKVEDSTMSGLKDFQRATVERIDRLFRDGQNRVLVADEVGMGKTLIARGTIVKTARIRMEEKDDLFKVVYICSNQNIANQNIRKLDVTNCADISSVSDTRLSMQHLKIAEQEYDAQIKEGFIQLIPLTPETSFRMTSGGGSVEERALMFAILRRVPELSGHAVSLEKYMVLDAGKAWESWAKYYYEGRVRNCSYLSQGEYPANVIRKIEEYPEVIEMLINHLAERRYNRELTLSNHAMMNKLRVMFARISVSMLQPDLVIMDEFQRFKFLLKADESELGILTQSFLHGTDTRVLLMSATPYKLYSTLEEIEENEADEHFEEFYQVMDFLFENRNSDFRVVWKNYSMALREVTAGDLTVLNMKKQAEDAMYRAVCRTERISVMESGDYTDDSNVKPLPVKDNDILSYVQLGKLMKNARVVYSVPVDYVKSCPYLMSFMRNYKLKEHIEKEYKANPGLIDGIAKAQRNMLWLNRSLLDDYEELPKTNARLEELKEKAFMTGAEKYLWVPPARPYYPLQGVYRDSQEFSKILVFSSWEMVPRMIGSMLSYEAERRTVGKISRQARNQDRKNAHYFAEGNKRYPAARLRFNVTADKAVGMSLFCLLYPSKSLAELYDPIDAINEDKSLEQIERDIRKLLTEKLKDIEERFSSPAVQGAEDNRWYYLAPMLMDGVGFSGEWIKAVTKEVTKDTEDVTAEKGNKGFFAHIDRLDSYLSNLGEVALGKKPDDLLDTLVNMTIASPAICIYRSNGNNMQRATALAKVFVNNFNQPESIAIVDLAYGRCRDDNSHWQNVLKYCKDGCFQAMYDEYLHMLSEAVGISENKDKSEVIHKIMLDSLKIHTASYAVDTFSAFRNRIHGNKGDGMRIRSSFAVGFTKDAADNAKIVNRKESVRNAFNSPLRPFVLATTSIGQEGLDFHYYCRRVMHWNLPSNPIDLEQREGRINRYKCFAIRQNVANKYGNIHFEKDVWREMFEAAKAEKAANQSELVPFWCFGKNQEVKIERIVPMYPMSRDEVNYQRLIRILSLYRLTLGQARQEELLEYLFKEFDDTGELRELFIDLSPFSRKKMGS